MGRPTETPAPPLPLPGRLLDAPAFVMYELLRRAKRRAEAQPGGPRLPGLTVLACLEEFGPQSQRDLCRRLGVDPSDMVGILDRLEADGLAVRERDPADRRRHAVALTDAGRAWLQDAEAALSARGAALLGGLSDEERALVTDLLRRALAHQDERVPDHYRTQRLASPRDGNRNHR